MVNAPVVVLPYFKEVFVFESDASGYGLGAVLMQHQNHVAYFSYSLTKREQLTPIYERELMTIVMVVQR